MDAETRQEFKTLIYEQFARVGKAFSNARRLEIIDLLAQTDHTVEDLSHKTGLSVASVSQHLQVLKNAKVVSVKREGNYAHYSLADARVFTIWRLMRELAQDRLADIDMLIRTYSEDRYSLETIDGPELLRRIKEGTITIIDARPTDEYRAGHLPNALSVPADQLEQYLDDLPDNCQIVAYCRASYCLLSDDVARVLKARGCDVQVYTGGFPDWQADGLPVEKGN